MVKVLQGGRPMCSGSLIGTDKVLTAAMCVNAGAPVVSHGNLEIKVEKTFRHPNFSLEDMSNNIAVLLDAAMPGNHYQFLSVLAMTISMSNSDAVRKTTKHHPNVCSTC